MPISNYPKGFANGLNIRGIPVLNSHGGSVFWVDSVAGSNGNKGTFDRPLADIDTAIGKCAANNGDIILVKPGHAETIIAASGITCDIAGVAIIGLGEGTDRPELTFGTSTAASIVISAANVTFQNIVGIGNIDGLTNPFHVQASDCHLDIEWRDTSSTVEAARAILGTAAADRLSVKLKYRGDTGGNAVVNAIRLVGTDGADLDVDFYGVASTAIVEFLTTACTNVNIKGTMYNSGTTNGSKNVVDTATGSTWYAVIDDASAGAKYSGGSGAALASDDASAIASALLVPVADVTTNTNERDVIGNKTDAAVTAVGTTKSLAAYAKGLVTMNTVQSADSTNNAFAGDVVGNKTDAAVYVPGTTKSVAAYVKGVADLQERVAFKAAAVMVDNDDIFTITGGPIEILSLVSVCVTTNDATASTLQYEVDPTVGAAATISGASASLANAAAGALVTLIGTTLATAALYSASSGNLGATVGIITQAGVISLRIGTGSTTGTWSHYLRYRPLVAGVTVA